MPDDGLISLERLIAESLAVLMRSLGESSRHVAFRIVRQSDESAALSPQDKDDILSLYGSMLRNPKVKRQLADFDPLEEVSLYLERFHDPVDDLDSSEQIFVLTCYKGRVVSYLHGSLRGATFFLWYLIGPRNISFAKLKGGMELPSNIDSAGFSEALVLKLLNCLCKETAAAQLVYAISAHGLEDPRSNERSRLKLFKGLEERIAKRAEIPWEWMINPALRRVDRAYVFNDVFVQPMIHQASIQRRDYLLVCVPLVPDVHRTFRSGSVPYGYYRSILESIYPMFYEFHERDESVASLTEHATESLLAEKDLKFGDGEVGVVSLSRKLGSAPS